MRKGMNPIIAGLATGAVVGTAAYMVTHKSNHAAKAIRKTTGKALKTVGNVIEHASYMMK